MSGTGVGLQAVCYAACGAKGSHVLYDIMVLSEVTCPGGECGGCAARGSPPLPRDPSPRTTAVLVLMRCSHVTIPPVLLRLVLLMPRDRDCDLPPVLLLYWYC
eukprot:1602117-Rhodomonas_salina.10